MEWLTIVWIAIGLGMDAFAVSLAVCACGHILKPRATFRLPFHFGLFQFMMPIIGWYLGSTIDQYIKDYDHWIAFTLLAIIGGKMIMESFDKNPEHFKEDDPTKGWSLVILSVATSIDALAVGLSMSFLGIEVWTPSIIIGIVAGAMTLVGMSFGKKLGMMFGKRMELIGGLVLIGIGIKIVIEHLN
ncbi:MAG: manganese efflux pump MntP family protein [Candidatus Zixiibacteriota bacterium]